MHIAILSREPKNYSTTRLVEAAIQRGHEVRVINPMKCYMDVASQGPKVYYEGGERIESFDAIIPRLGASITFYGTAVLRQYEMMGIYTVNESLAIVRSRDKLRALQLLARKGIGMPVTAYADSPAAIDHVLEIVGGPPVIIKLIEGTQGLGVVLAETKSAAESAIQAFQGLKANILVQEFIEEAQGSDIRCFVVGDKVVAAMKRTGREGEFRSNVHRGGTTAAVRITPEERKMAVRTAKIMGLKVAGVDILRSDHGPLVMEVNSSPGLKGIEDATGKDIACHIIRFIEKDVKRPKGRRPHAKG